MKATILDTHGITSKEHDIDSLSSKDSCIRLVVRSSVRVWSKSDMAVTKMTAWTLSKQWIHLRRWVLTFVQSFFSYESQSQSKHLKMDDLKIDSPQARIKGPVSTRHFLLFTGQKHSTISPIAIILCFVGLFYHFFDLSSPIFPLRPLTLCLVCLMVHSALIHPHGVNFAVILRAVFLPVDLCCSFLVYSVERKAENIWHA